MNQQQTLMAGPGVYPQQASGGFSCQMPARLRRDEESCMPSPMTGNMEKILATTRGYWAIPASRPRRY